MFLICYFLQEIERLDSCEAEGVKQSSSVFLSTKAVFRMLRQIAAGCAFLASVGIQDLVSTACKK